MNEDPFKSCANVEHEVVKDADGNYVVISRLTVTASLKVIAEGVTDDYLRNYLEGIKEGNRRTIWRQLYGDIYSSMQKAKESVVCSRMDSDYYSDVTKNAVERTISLILSKG